MSVQTSGEAAKWGSDKGRIEAFSDGVFAVAITLLVFNLKVPTADDLGANGLAGYLLGHWQTYGAYVLSFLTVLLMWIAHHNFFNYVARVDTGILITNGIQLMGVTIVPFTTALLAQSPTYPGQDDGRLAAALYSGNFAFITFMIFVQFMVAAHAGKVLRVDLRPGLVGAIRIRNLIGPTFYFIAILLGLFVNAWVCLALCGLLLIYYAVVILFLARRWFEG